MYEARVRLAPYGPGANSPVTRVREVELLADIKEGDWPRRQL